MPYALICGSLPTQVVSFIDVVTATLHMIMADVYLEG